MKIRNCTTKEVFEELGFNEGNHLLEMEKQYKLELEHTILQHNNYKIGISGDIELCNGAFEYILTDIREAGLENHTVEFITKSVVIEKDFFFQYDIMVDDYSYDIQFESHQKYEEDSMCVTISYTIIYTSVKWKFSSILYNAIFGTDNISKKYVMKEIQDKIKELIKK